MRVSCEGASDRSRMHLALILNPGQDEHPGAGPWPSSPASSSVTMERSSSIASSDWTEDEGYWTPLSTRGASPSEHAESVRLPSFTHGFLSIVDANESLETSGPASLSKLADAAVQHGSVDSGSSRHAPRGGHRPIYTEEEMDFLWFARDTCGQTWKEVLRLFNAFFPTRDRGGLECKYYRYLEARGCPPVRARSREESADGTWTLNARMPHVHYWWMENLSDRVQPNLRHLCRFPIASHAD